MTGTGIASSRPVASVRKPGAKPEIGRPSVNRSAARDAHHAQRGDEWRQPPQGDQQAVDQPKRGSGQKACQQRRRQRQTRLEDTREHHTRDRDQRADREIDPARENDVSHPDGDDGVDGGLLEDVEQTRSGQEVRRENPQDQTQHHEAQQGAQSAARPGQRLGSLPRTKFSAADRWGMRVNS